MKRVDKVAALIEAAEAMISEPDCLDYPVRDVYGFNRREDREAPLWTESGTYGRLGKEAARTVLVRHGRLVSALSALTGKRYETVHDWGRGGDGD